ncbi:MAG: NAD-binding protein [Treponema sp.]|jgi:trk system potassium uptake protein TrkA|nr:NAD-binding protein [Treponema sp.]
MRIVIVGAGQVGTQLSRHLIQEKHDVSLIESNEEWARHASNRLDCLVVPDEGNNINALEEAGIAKADALVCVTGSDEVNMLICGLVASRYPDVIKIARVRNDDYVRLNHEVSQPNQRILGIDHFVHPDVAASRSVLNAVSHGASGDILAFAGTTYKIGSVDIMAGSSFDGLSLKDFRTIAPMDSLVTLIERKGVSLLPSGATQLAKGDRIHVLAQETALGAIFNHAGHREVILRKIGVVGGGRVGALIAGGLLRKTVEEQGPAPAKKKLAFVFSLFKKLVPKSFRRVIVIEQDYQLCKDLAARFPEALVLNQDISDESFVVEERLNDLDLIITATGNQELNLITAVYLKSRGVRRAIVLVTGTGYAAMGRQLGLDVVIPMQSVVVDSILSVLMGSGVKGIHRIGDGNIDVIEIEISSNAPVVNKPITALRFSAGGLVMLVARGETSFIPKGDYVFTAGDRIIIIVKKKSEKEIEQFFGVQ